MKPWMDGLSQSSAQFTKILYVIEKKPLKFSDLWFVFSNWVVWRTNEWLCRKEWYNITNDKIFRVIDNDSSIVVIWCLEQVTFLVLFKLCMPSVKWRLMVIQCLVGLWSFFSGFSSSWFFLAQSFKSTKINRQLFDKSLSDITC